MSVRRSVGGSVGRLVALSVGALHINFRPALASRSVVKKQHLNLSQVVKLTLQQFYTWSVVDGLTSSPVAVAVAPLATPTALLW